MRDLHTLFDLKGLFHPLRRYILYVIEDVANSPLRVVFGLVDRWELVRAAPNIESDVSDAYRFDHGARGNG